MPAASRIDGVAGALLVHDDLGDVRTKRLDAAGLVVEHRLSDSRIGAAQNHGLDAVGRDPVPIHHVGCVFEHERLGDPGDE